MRGVTLSGLVSAYGSLLSHVSESRHGAPGVERFGVCLWFVAFPCLRSEAWGTQFGGGDFGFMIGSDDHAI
jgi:hypothetical protein